MNEADPSRNQNPKINYVNPEDILGDDFFEDLDDTDNSSEAEQLGTPMIDQLERMQAVEDDVSERYLDRSGTPKDTPDSRFIAENEEDVSPEARRYMIPSYRRLRKDMEEPDEIDLFERAVRKIGEVGYMMSEGGVSGNSSKNNQSLRNKQAMDKLNELQSTGDDSQIRNLWVTETSPGVYQTIIQDGKDDEVPTALVKEAQEYFLSDPASFQAALWYEINKATSEDDLNRVMDKAADLLNIAANRGRYDRNVRFSDSDVMGIIAGVGFMHKSQHFTFKYSKWKKDEYGMWRFSHIDSVEMIRELSTKFRSFDYANFQPPDVANIGTIAREALETSIRYRHTPDEEEFKRSQFVLQRIHKIISDMRGPQIGGDPEKDNEAEAASIQRAHEMQGLLGGVGRQRPAVSVSPDGKVEYYNADVRTGSAPVASELWKTIAQLSDQSAYIFPNIKYLLPDEISTIEDRIRHKAKGIVDPDQRRAALHDEGMKLAGLKDKDKKSPRIAGGRKGRKVRRRLIKSNRGQIPGDRFGKENS